MAEAPTLPATLRLLRQAKGLTLRAVARRVGVSHGTVALWESGDTTPDSLTAERYAQVLDLDQATLNRLLEQAQAAV